MNSQVGTAPVNLYNFRTPQGDFYTECTGGATTEKPFKKFGILQITLSTNSKIWLVSNHQTSETSFPVEIMSRKKRLPFLRIAIIF